MRFANLNLPSQPVRFPLWLVSLGVLAIIIWQAGFYARANVDPTAPRAYGMAAADRLGAPGFYSAGVPGLYALTYPKAIFDGKHDSIRSGNAFFFTLGLILIFVICCRNGRPFLGMFFVLLLGAHPLQLYEVYQTESAGSWFVTLALLILAAYLPLFLNRNHSSNQMWLSAIVIGGLFGWMRMVNLQPMIMMLAAFLLFFLYHPADSTKKVTFLLIAILSYGFAETGFKQVFKRRLENAPAYHKAKMNSKPIWYHAQTLWGTWTGKIPTEKIPQGIKNTVQKTSLKAKSATKKATKLVPQKKVRRGWKQFKNAFPSTLDRVRQYSQKALDMPLRIQFSWGPGAFGIPIPGLLTFALLLLMLFRGCRTEMMMATLFIFTSVVALFSPTASKDYPYSYFHLVMAAIALEWIVCRIFFDIPAAAKGGWDNFKLNRQRSSLPKLPSSSAALMGVPPTPRPAGGSTTITLK